MKTSAFKVTFDGMDSSEVLKKYLSEKLAKFENFLELATLGEVVFKQNAHRRGKKDDLSIDINVYLPKSKINVEERGDNMYELIDFATDLLARRLKRYHDKLKQWEGQVPWKVIEAEEELKALEKDIDEDANDYSDYIPKISKRTKLDDLSPIEEAEAIEKMELLGRDQFFFKNKSLGEFCMIYRLKSGEYGIIQPS